MPIFPLLPAHHRRAGDRREWQRRQMPLKEAEVQAFFLPDFLLREEFMSSFLFLIFSFLLLPSSKIIEEAFSTGREDKRKVSKRRE